MDDKMKHTPGPWKHDTNGGCKAIKGGKAGRSNQARYRDVAYTVGRAEDEDLANARLIAAAPDLLEALQFYVTICGNTAHSIDPQTAREMYDKGRAAIDKALGR